MSPDALVARLPAPLRRLSYRLAHCALAVWWAVRRPHTHGVKLVLRDGERVLLVRHTYGDRGRWELPGGGIRAGETPAAAARREAGEELGQADAGWTAFGEATLRGHRTTTLHGFTAPWDGRPLRLDPGEIAECAWWGAELPQRRGADVAGLVAGARSARPGRGQSSFSPQ